MREVIEREDERMAERYVASKRHTIQVDFYPYLRTIERERRRGRLAVLAGRWPNRSHELRLARRAHERLRARLHGLARERGPG